MAKPLNSDLDLSVSQILGAWRIMCGRPGVSANGVDYIFSGVPVAFFNVAVLTARDVAAGALEAAGTAACTWAADKAVPWLFMVTHETLTPGTDAAATLERCDLAPMMAMTGMIADHVSDVAHVPDGLELAVPQDD